MSTLMQDAWEKYRAVMVPPNTTDEQELVQRRAFFAGYASLWQAINGDEDIDLHDVNAEVTAFAEQPEFTVMVDVRDLLIQMARRLIIVAVAGMTPEGEDMPPSMDELECHDRRALFHAASGSIIQSLIGQAPCTHAVAGVWDGFCTSYVLTALAKSVDKGQALDLLASNITRTWNEELGKLMREAKTMGLAS